MRPGPHRPGRGRLPLRRRREHPRGRLLPARRRRPSSATTTPPPRWRGPRSTWRSGTTTWPRPASAPNPARIRRDRDGGAPASRSRTPRRSGTCRRATTWSIRGPPASSWWTRTCWWPTTAASPSTTRWPSWRRRPRAATAGPASWSATTRPPPRDRTTRTCVPAFMARANRLVQAGGGKLRALLRGARPRARARPVAGGAGRPRLGERRAGAAARALPVRHAGGRVPALRLGALGVRDPGGRRRRLALPLRERRGDRAVLLRRDGRRRLRAGLLPRRPVSGFAPARGGARSPCASAMAERPPFRGRATTLANAAIPLYSQAAPDAVPRPGAVG